jgi:hypothetical protein
MWLGVLTGSGLEPEGVAHGLVLIPDERRSRWLSFSRTSAGDKVGIWRGVGRGRERGGRWRRLWGKGRVRVSR